MNLKHIELHLKVRGITKYAAVHQMDKYGIGEFLYLAKDDRNPFDKNAIKIYDLEGDHIGYVPATHSLTIRSFMEQFDLFYIEVSDIYLSKKTPSIEFLIVFCNASELNNFEYKPGRRLLKDDITLYNECSQDKEDIPGLYVNEDFDNFAKYDTGNPDLDDALYFIDEFDKEYFTNNNPKKALSMFIKHAEQYGYEICSVIALEEHEHGNDDLYYYFNDLGAKHGVIDCYNNLGICYQQGLGVYPDDEKAAYWFKKGADNNISESIFNLGVAYEDGCGVLQSDTKAFECYLRCAKLGNLDGMYNTAIAYLNGRGIMQNISQARYWLENLYSLNPDDLEVRDILLELKRHNLY